MFLLEYSVCSLRKLFGFTCWVVQPLSFAGYRIMSNIYRHLLVVLVSSSWVFGTDPSKCFLHSLLTYFRYAAGSAE